MQRILLLISYDQYIVDRHLIPQHSAESLYDIQSNTITNMKDGARRGKGYQWVVILSQSTRIYPEGQDVDQFLRNLAGNAM